MTKAEAENMRPAFPLFSNLPPELRNQIWHEALPHDDDVQPALYFYKTGCWNSRMLVEEDEGYMPGQPGNNLTLEFRHDKLDLARVEVPLAKANTEAQSIVLAWAREKGYCVRTERGGPVILRAFDPYRDILYIAQSRWITFLDEPSERLFWPDLVHKNIQVRAHIWRIAVPESFIWNQATNLANFVSDWDYNYTCIKKLYIIIDPPEELDREATETSSDNNEVPSYWRLKELQVASSWDGEAWTRKGNMDDGIEHDHTNNQLQQPWPPVLDEATLKFQNGLTEVGNTQFEIQPSLISREPE